MTKILLNILMILAILASTTNTAHADNEMCPIDPGRMSPGTRQSLGLPASVPPTETITPEKAMQTLPNIRVSYYAMDRNVAAKAGYSIFAASGDERTVVYIQEFAMYRLAGSDSHPYSEGIAIRMVISVKNASLAASLLSFIGASANDDRAQITVQVLGMNGKAVMAAVPDMPQSLNASAFQSMIGSFAKLKNLLYTCNPNDISLSIVPIMAPIQTQSKPETQSGLRSGPALWFGAQ